MSHRPSQGSSANPIDLDDDVEVKHTPPPDLSHDPTKYRLDYNVANPVPDKDTKAKMRAMLGLSKSTSIFGMSSMNQGPTSFAATTSSAPSTKPIASTKTEMLKNMLDINQQKRTTDKPLFTFGAATNASTQFTFGAPSSFTPATTSTPVLPDKPTTYRTQDILDTTFDSTQSLDASLIITDEIPAIVPILSLSRSPGTAEPAERQDDVSLAVVSECGTEDVSSVLNLSTYIERERQLSDKVVVQRERTVSDSIECVSDKPHVDNVLDKILGPSCSTPSSSRKAASSSNVRRAGVNIQMDNGSSTDSTAGNAKRDRESPVKAPTGKRRRVENKAPTITVENKAHSTNTEEFIPVAPSTNATEDDDEIQFIPFTQRPISHVPANTQLIDVGIFWDIENLRVPMNGHPAIILNELRRRVVDCQPHFREAIFYVVCDVYRERPDLIHQLFEFHVRVVHVPGLKSNAADNVLRDLMVEFVGHHSGKCPRVVLMSGDSDFSHDIYNFRNKERCDVVLVHNPQARQSMVSSATSAFLFEELYLAECPNPRFRFPQQTKHGQHKHIKQAQNQFVHPVPPHILNQAYTPSVNSNQNRQNSTAVSQSHTPRRNRKDPKTGNFRFFNRAAPEHASSVVPALNTSASHLPEFIPVQSKAQKFYRQAKRRMMGKGRSPMQAKNNYFTKAKNRGKNTNGNNPTGIVFVNP